MKSNYLPEIFEINYKEDNNETKSIKLIGDSLLVNNPNPELIEVNKIHEEKWIEFWEKMEMIGLWDIKEEYLGCTLEGGFIWNINISHNSKEMHSYGANVEPKIVIGDKIQPILDELFKSIEDLIGFE